MYIQLDNGRWINIGLAEDISEVLLHVHQMYCWNDGEWKRLTPNEKVEIIEKFYKGYIKYEKEVQ